MKTVRLALLIAVVSSFAFGQRQEIKELQRDVAILQDTIRQLQESINERLKTLTDLVRTGVDSSTKANTSIAVIDTSLRNSVREQEKTVTSLNTRVEQLSTDFSTLRETVADMNSRLMKVQAQITDLHTAVTTLSSPPAPPTGIGTGGPPPGMTAESLFQNASRDQSAGNADLALQQYNDFLRFYGTTDLAPVAQFNIGQIQYSKGALDEALQAFDLVIEKFPANSKTLDAHYMKGMTLIKMKQPTRAAQEFREIIKLSPSSQQATNAKLRLKDLGLPYTGTTRRKR